LPVRVLELLSGANGPVQEGEVTTRTSDSAAAAASPDAELVVALKRGDDGAYEELVRANTGRMLAVARRYLRNDEDARDAVQEAFVNAFRAIDKFEGGALLSTWLHRILVNACLMRLRRRRRKPEESIDDLLPKFIEDGHLRDPAGAWNDGADELMEQAENRVLVREAIDRLPDSYRTVLLLRDIEGLDTEETASQLGISKAAVKTRLHRARLALRGLLDEHFRSPE
jgi:RNA polymerase sigma-70 factor (ECF subfamily)